MRHDAKLPVLTPSKRLLKYVTAERANEMQRREGARMVRENGKELLLLPYEESAPRIVVHIESGPVVPGESDTLALFGLQKKGTGFVSSGRTRAAQTRIEAWRNTHDDRANAHGNRRRKPRRAARGASDAVLRRARRQHATSAPDLDRDAAGTPDRVDGADRGVTQR